MSSISINSIIVLKFLVILGVNNVKGQRTRQNFGETVDYHDDNNRHYGSIPNRLPHPSEFGIRNQHSYSQGTASGNVRRPGNFVNTIDEPMGSATHYSNEDVEYDNYAAETGYNHDHGHGHGWKKKGCAIALGVIAILGLLFYLMTLLNQMSGDSMTTTVAPRKKRFLPEDYFSTPKMFGEPNVGKLAQLLLPFMTSVGHARDGHLPLNCTLINFCQVNPLLIRELGYSYGQFVGDALSKKASRMLQNVDKRINFVELVEQISKERISLRKCEEKYKYCPIIHTLPSYSIPTGFILMH